MKVRIKEVPKGWKCDYLTIGKEYEAKSDTAIITDDEGDEITIRLSECGFLNDGSWEIVEEVKS